MQGYTPMPVFRLVPAVYSFAGQRCTAPRRLIVAQSQADVFTQAFIGAAQSLKIGLPSDPETQSGPMISRGAQARMTQLVRESVQGGGQVLCGGRIPPDHDAGCWFEPTLLSELDLRARAVQEESFGPLAILMIYHHFEEALRL